MVLHRTGSENEIVYLNTSCLNVTIKKAEINLPFIQTGGKEASLKIVCDDDFDVNLSGNAETVFSQYLGKAYSAEFRHIPMFYEQKNYEIIIESVEGHKVEFWHENYHIRNKVTQVGHLHSLLTGVINFENDIGFSDLVFLIDGEQYLKLTIEVFPSKINYKEDYLAIISDVTKEIYNLVFDFLKKTYSSFDIASTGRASLVEFFAIIQKIYGEYLSAVDMILRSPHHILKQDSEVLAQHKIRRYDKKTLQWLEKHPGEVVRDIGGIKVEKALAVHKYVTYDTRENRLTKYMLEQTSRRLERFKSQYMKMDRETDSAIIDIINGMISGIQRRCNTGYMKEVPSQATNSGMSLVFGMAPGYRQLYRCYLLLQHGLSVTGDIFNVSVKDLAELYEYWCFIKLNSLLKEKYELDWQDIIKTEGNGISISLVKGRDSRVRYKDLKTGEIITLFYNPQSNKMPTVNQRPDNVLCLQKKGADLKYEYVFDAKYKINPALPGSYYAVNICEKPGPEVDDINTMHRYRDAIVYKYNADSYERVMFGAYVLFPYANEEEYKNHRFYKSIEKVNIGGLPFLPSSTKLVTEMLDDLITESPQSAFERATLPRGTERKLRKVNWNRREVLVGSVRSEKQFGICLRQNFYYVPAGFLSEKDFPIDIIAIYQPKSIFGKEAGIEYYGEVVLTEIIKRCDILEIPKESDDPYYRFTIRNWEKLKRKIEIKEHGVRGICLTNTFLLKNSTLVPELFLKTEEEYRVYTELKRIVGDATLLNNEHSTGFKLGQYTVFFEDGEIRMYNHAGVMNRCIINDFVQKPNVRFKSLMRLLR